MSRSGYVGLKHALSAVALRVVETPTGVPTAEALAAYARLGGGHAVPVSEIARALGTTSDDVRHRLMETGLFDAAAGGDHPALAAAYAPYAAYFARQAVRMAEAVRVLGEPAPPGVPDVVRRGIALFNAGLFYECHEYLEGAWRATRGQDRAFYHGLIQAAAACYHCEKGSRHGTRILAGKAVEKLRAFTPAYHGVGVAALLVGLEVLCAGAGSEAAGLPRSRGDLPVITLAAAPGA